MNFIDGHVHFRDFEEEDKETIKNGLEVARDSGLVAVLDMPNNKPAVMSRVEIENKIRKAKDADVKEVLYRCFMGITSDLEQIKEAVYVCNKYEQVPGIKVYLGHSTGRLGITLEEEQRFLMKTLTNLDYRGLLVAHCEKEDHIHDHIWTPDNPISHCHARPEESEIASVEDLLSMVIEFNFKGRVHVAHISSPTAVDLVYNAKMAGMDITCGSCPHHWIYDWNRMNEPDGLYFKMNPPLRSPESQQGMFEYLRTEKIDMIETDHAPHKENEKNREGGIFMSGIPGLASWPIIVEYLRFNNFSEKLIEKLVFLNPAKLYNLDVNTRKVNYKDRRGDYPYDPYEPMAKQKGWDKRKYI